MKIALLSYEYPPDTGFGGIGTYTWYQARALAKLGHDVHVLAGAVEPTPLRTTTHDGVVVHRYRARGLFMRACAWLDRPQLWWTKNRLENGWSMHAGLRLLLKQHRFDVVEMPECGAEGWRLTRRIGLPTLVRFHSPAAMIMRYYDVRPADVRYCAAVERVAIRRAGAFSACSRFMAAEAERELGVPRAIRVIPNGLDLGLFDAADQVDARRLHDLPADRPLVVFTGRMERRKGIELCPQIVTRVLERHDAAFVFAGRDLFGYMANTLLPQLQHRSLRGSVHFLGSLDLTGVRSLLRQADVYFLPSLWENCPYSCLEAMAAGLAIVSSDQGGMPELIEDGVNGLLAESGNVDAYVAGLGRLLEDGALRRRLGAAARRTVETSFTDVRVAEQSVAGYRDCRPGA
jgi:glycosyltransferase involved in cell wall biosynthesis